MQIYVDSEYSFDSLLSQNGTKSLPRGYDCVRAAGQAAEMVVGVGVIDGPAAAVEEQRHRQPAFRARLVPANGMAPSGPGTRSSRPSPSRREADRPRAGVASPAWHRLPAG